MKYSTTHIREYMERQGFAMTLAHFSHDMIEDKTLALMFDSYWRLREAIGTFLSEHDKDYQKEMLKKLDERMRAIENQNLLLTGEL